MDIKYGKRILSNYLTQLERYIVVTMDIPWKLCKHLFEENMPVQVVIIDTLDKETLDRLSCSFPKVNSIVGLGGGTAIDAAKYFAYLQDLTPILVPTISSTNAPFSDFISIKKDGSAFGFKIASYPKQLVIDYDILSLSDQRLNRAGYGDLLYMQTTLNDWLIGAKKGRLASVNPKVRQRIEEMMGKVTKHAKEIGNVTEDGLHLLMENTRFSTELYKEHPDAPISAGSEHLFAWNLEMTTKKNYIHGEIVALGIVIVSYLQQFYLSNSSLKILRQALEDAQVIYHPDDIGITWQEIKETLMTVNGYNHKFRRFHTVFDYVTFTSDVLANLKDYLYKECSECEV